MHVGGHRKIFEVGYLAAPRPLLHAPQFVLRLDLRRNIFRMDRFPVQLLGEIQQRLRQLLLRLQSVGARPAVQLFELVQLLLQAQIFQMEMVGPLLLAQVFQTHRTQQRF